MPADELPGLFASSLENSDIPNGDATVGVMSKEKSLVYFSLMACLAASDPEVPNGGNIWTATLVAAAIPALPKLAEVEEDLADTVLPPCLREEGGCAFQLC